MSLQKTYSVVVPTYNEEETISNCLQSLVNAEFTEGAVEILVVDGQSTDATRSIVGEFANEYEFVSLHTEYDGSTAAALNVGIERSQHEVVVFVGGHSTVSSGFFTELDRTFQEIAPDADVVGGVMVPVPQSRFERYVSIALRTPLGSSSSRFRPVEGYVDTVNFGAYRRHVIEDVGLIDNDLDRAEDYEYNVRVQKHGYRIYQNPAVKVSYRPRSTIEGLVQQYFGNGFWKPHAHAKHDARFSAIAESPLFVRAAVALGFLFVMVILSPLVIAGGFIYLLATAAVVAQMCWKTEDATLFDILPVTVVLLLVHASFGCGFGYGLATLGQR